MADSNKVNLFLSLHAKDLPERSLLSVKTALTNASDEKVDTLSLLQFKDPTTMLIISLFLGGLGIDRMMLGDTGLGVLKLITCGGCGIWALIDLFWVSNATREYNYRKLMTALAY